MKPHSDKNALWRFVLQRILIGRRRTLSATSGQRSDGGNGVAAKRPSLRARAVIVGGIAVAAVAAWQFLGALGGGGEAFEQFRPVETASRLAENPLDHETRFELARFYLHKGNEALRRDRGLDEIVTDSELVGYFESRLADLEGSGEDVTVLRGLLHSDFGAFHSRFTERQSVIARDMFERSILLFRQAIALGADISSKNYYHLGTAYYQLGPEGYSGASKYLARAVESGLLSTRALTFLGNVAMARGDLTEGAELYEKAIELSPEDPVLAFNLALAYKESAQIDLAVRYFRETLRLYQDREDLAEDELSIILQAHLALGWCLLKAGEYADAESEFEAVLAGQPNSVEGHYWMGIAYERQRRYEAARAHWQKVKELRDGFRDVNERLSALRR